MLARWLETSLGPALELGERCEQRRHDERREHERHSASHAAPCSVQPTASTAIIAIGTRLRRRLSKIFQRDSVEIGLPRRARRPRGTQRQEPARDLPVAADPARPAGRLDRVRRRVVFEHDHVADQPGAAVRTLEEVMAEHAVVGERALEDIAQRIEIVDALADERALGEQVLIDVADRARVRIDAGLGCEQLGEARAVRAIGRDRDPRLQDRVAVRSRACGPCRSTGRFSGCAIAPTSSRAASRGRPVSLSSTST